MSNCVVSSAQERSGEACIPGGVVADHGVQGGDNLSHDGDDGDLRFLPGGREAFVEGFERRIISTGTPGSPHRARRFGGLRTALITGRHSPLRRPPYTARHWAAADRLPTQ